MVPLYVPPSGAAIPDGTVSEADLDVALQAKVTAGSTAVQPADLGGAAVLDVGTTAGTVCAGDDGRLLTTDQETQIAAAAVLCATATVCTVADGTITTAENATFTCTPSPSFASFSTVDPEGTVQLYVAGSTPLGSAQPLASGTVDIVVAGTALDEGTHSVTARYIPAAGQPWLTSTSAGVEVVVSAP